MADKLNLVRDYVMANGKALLIGALCGMLVGCVL
jgi:hypothetical protein